MLDDSSSTSIYIETFSRNAIVDVSSTKESNRTSERCGLVETLKKESSAHHRIASRYFISDSDKKEKMFISSNVRL